MSFSTECEDRDAADTHLSVWPWSDLGRHEPQNSYQFALWKIVARTPSV